LNTSLSIVLPVYNREHRLHGQVNDLLDVLPELTHSFEVLIVDDGSTDDTAHVAADLALIYPQVRVVRHPIRLGLAEAIQTGLDNTQGEIVLVGDEEFGLGLEDLQKLWLMREDNELVVARQTRVDKPERFIDKLLGWTPSRRQGSRHVPASHVIRREAFDEMRRFEADRLQAISHRVDKVEAPLRPSLLGKIKRFAMEE
jgi:glycosyltransferase involved in cell wall biosynthesis